MTREFDNHLSNDEFDELLISSKSELSTQTTEDVRHHLEICEECNRKFQLHKYLENEISHFSDLKEMNRSGHCHDESEWLQLAAGIAEENEARLLLSHAAECANCSAVLTRTLETLSEQSTPFENTLLANVRSADPAWQSRLADSLVRESRGKPGKQNSFGLRLFDFPRWTFALTASVIMALLLILVPKWWRQQSPEQLLAQAYANDRTLELRIAGAKYAPFRQQRGSARSSLEKPSELLKAEYQIKEILGSNPDDIRALAAKGRAEILEWQYDDAIRTLGHAIDLGDNSPNVLCDLATAFIERGDIERRPSDYGQAIEYLGQVLHDDPNNNEALFNQAIANERLQLLEEAMKDWQKYLQLDPSSEWASEARQRLKLLEEKIKHALAVPHAEPDPILAAIILKSHHRNGSLNTDIWPDSLDEDYLDVAVMRWIPALARSSSTSHQKSSRPAELKALRELAYVLKIDHHDYWLSDVLTDSKSKSGFDGWIELARAINSNLIGEYEVAAREASRAERILKRLDKPAYLRAVWERAYSLQRSQQGNNCVASLSKAGSFSRLEIYPWILTQLMLEHAICSSMVGEMRNAQTEIQSASGRAERAHYETLQLRAQHIMGIQAASQDPELAWQFFTDGLRQHWKGAYRPFRAYQFYAEMSFNPETLGEWQLARVLMEEAVTHIARTPNLIMEGAAHQSLAVDAELAGYPSEALAEFKKAAGVYSSLPPSSSRDGLIFTAKVYQASLLSEQGKTLEALDALREAQRVSSPRSQYWLWLHYYTALGETRLRLGATDDAELALRSAVYLSEAVLSNIRNETDRLLWERYASRAYRSLVELEFVQKHDPKTALDLWEWYVSAPLRSNRTEVQVQIDFNRMKVDPPWPNSNLVAAARLNLKDVAVVSVAELNGGYLVWFLDEGGLNSRFVDVDARDVRREVRRLLRLCSDPSSKVADIRKSGKVLYDLFLAPFSARLTVCHLLLFEPDGLLRDAPIGAFVSANGEFLGEQMPVVVFPGFGLAGRLRDTYAYSSADNILAVAIPEAIRYGGLRLPALPDSEAEAHEICSYFSNPALIVGDQANISKIKRKLRTVRVFHFAGHAVSSLTRSGLMISGETEGPNRGQQSGTFVGAEQIRRFPLKNVALVVLSACTTAEREGEMRYSQGLVQIFEQAGVPDVVATRWDVDSHAAREIMREFYTSLVAGEDPAHALKSATDVLRTQKETSHPYYWASFAIFGSSNSLKSRSQLRSQP